MLTAVLLLDHGIFHAVWMISGGTIEKGGVFLSWLLFGLMLTHAVISIDLAVSNHAETKK